MHGGDHEARRHPHVDERGLAELQARLDGFRHRVGGAEIVEPARMLGVAGAGHDREVAPLRPRRFHHLFGDPGIVQRHHEPEGGPESAFLEEIVPPAVAVIDRGAGVALATHEPGVAVDRDEGQPVQRHHLADEPPHPSVAHDDDPRFAVVGRRLGRYRQRGRAPPDPLAEAGDERDQHHGEGDGDGRDLGHRRRQQPRPGGLRHEHEGEFAGRAEQQRHLAGHTPRQPEQPGQPVDHQRLHGDDAEAQRGDQFRPGREDAEVEAGADRHEEEAEQQPLEGLDRHLDLAPELRFGEQQPGQEGAERHGQPRPPPPSRRCRSRRAGRPP